MEKWSDFDWPLNAHERMRREPSDVICVDLLDTSIDIFFAPYCELQIPLPNGFKFELGSDGETDWGLNLSVPCLRVWFDVAPISLESFTRGETSVAFMETPRVTPDLHVNIDLWGGFEVGMNIEEKSSMLDDIIEYVLTGFGPCKPVGSVPSWLGARLGSLVVGSLDKFAQLGNGRPFTIGLKLTSAAVKAQIELFEALLAKVEEAEDPEAAASAKGPLSVASALSSLEEGYSEEVGAKLRKLADYLTNELGWKRVEDVLARVSEDDFKSAMSKVGLNHRPV